MVFQVYPTKYSDIQEVKSAVIPELKILQVKGGKCCVNAVSAIMALCNQELRSAENTWSLFMKAHSCMQPKKNILELSGGNEHAYSYATKRGKETVALSISPGLEYLCQYKGGTKAIANKEVFLRFIRSFDQQHSTLYASNPGNPECDKKTNDELRTKVADLEQRLRDSEAAASTWEMRVKALETKEKAIESIEELKRKRDDEEYDRKRKLEREEDEEREYRRMCEREQAHEQKEEERDLKITRSIMDYMQGNDATRMVIAPTLNQLLKHRYSDETTRVEFIKNLTKTIDKQTIEYAGVYVLKLQGLPFTHYVGSSKTVIARIEQHRRGDGAFCIKKATAIEQVATLSQGSVENLDDWERIETLTLMYRLGMHNVRGWLFIQQEISDQQRMEITASICAKNKLCLRCGAGSHMVTKCFARSRSFWMGGGAL